MRKIKTKRNKTTIKRSKNRNNKQSELIEIWNNLERQAVLFDKLRYGLYKFIHHLDEDRILMHGIRIKMVKSLSYFIERAIQKFIKGQKEHGGLITDASRNLDNEIANEILDLFWYSSAKQWKKQ